MLASEAANVDILSQGRLIVCVGVATNNESIAREFTACGVDFAHRLGIFEECVTLMRRLWTEPSVTFQGRRFQLQDVSLGLRPIQTSGIPIWIAGAVDNAQRRVLRLGDGWFPIPRSPEAFATQWERLQVLAREMGKDAQALLRGVYNTPTLNNDLPQAQRAAQAF